MQNRGWPRKPRAGRVNSRAVSTFVAAVAQPPRRFHTSPGRCDACHAPAVTAPPAGVTRIETAIRRVLPSAQRGLAGPSWWRKARAVPALGDLRGDARANAVKVGYRLALSARPDGTSAPTWEGLMAATGLSRW